MRYQRSFIIVALLFLVVGGNEMFAASVKATRYRHHRQVRTRRHARIRRLVWNPVLRGSRESMLRQNEEINRLQLMRINNDLELDSLIAADELVRIEDTSALKVSASLKENRKYCRPWTLDFLTDVSEAYYEKFHKPLQLTSAVRTVEQQKKLRRHNRNAAPIDGDTASSHLAGLTVDIGKAGMSKKERAWFDQYLLPMQNAHVIEAAEERRQACYHIMVGERYSDWADGQDDEQNELATSPLTTPVAGPPAAAAVSPAVAAEPIADGVAKN